MPFFRWNWLAESLVVLFYFPLVVSLRAGSKLSIVSKPLCVFSGMISYPLYMAHYAAIWVFGHYYAINKPTTWELSIIIITGTILLVGFAYLVMVLYDIPIRRYLTTKRQQKLEL